MNRNWQSSIQRFVNESSNSCSCQEVLQTDPEYYIICNYCNDSQLHFLTFDEFLEHVKKFHVAMTSFSITSKDNFDKGLRPAKRFTFNPMENADDMSSNSSNLYDLSSLSRDSLLELITLLQKCLCIWHKPTRTKVSRKTRLCAYQLLLLKLRQYKPETDFHDIRSIVRQLITNFFDRMDSNGSDADADKEDNCFGESSKQARARLLLLDPTRSRTVLEKLKFLIKVEDEDIDDLNLYQLCSFCNSGFGDHDTLWNHMIADHLTHAKKTLTNLNTTVMMSVMSDPATNIFGHTRSQESRRCNYNSPIVACDSEFNSNNIAYHTENSYKLRNIKYKRRIRSDGANSKRRKVFLTSSATSEITNDTSQKRSRSFYLNEYDDEFLEKFINLYRKHECLWQENSELYNKRKWKSIAFDEIAELFYNERNKEKPSHRAIRELIRKVKAHYHRLKRPGSDILRSHIWNRLSFLEVGRRTILPPIRKRRLQELCVKNRYTFSSATSIGSVQSSEDLYCTKCKKKFKRSFNLKKHIRIWHPVRKCIPCSIKFNTVDSLKEHILTHHPLDNHCPLCPRKKAEWNNGEHLAQHFYEHKCLTCTTIFYDPDVFQKHKLKCPIQKHLQCHHCKEEFERVLDFRRHAKEFHNDSEPFKCIHCRVSFKHLMPLSRHLQVHKYDAKLSEVCRSREDMQV